MKTVNTLFALSLHLVLHADIALSRPILRETEATSNDGGLSLLISREYPIITGDSDMVEWQRRAPTQTQQKAVIRKTNSVKHSAESATTSKSITPASVTETKNDQPALTREQKGISKAKYHAQAFAINSKQAGKELFHGPVRGLTEAPVSSLLGSAHHLWTGCRYMTGCQMENASDHFTSIFLKPVLGAFAAVYLTGKGLVHATPPAGRAIGHLGGMTAQGMKQGYNRVIHGQKSEKSLERQQRIEEAKKRPIRVLKDTRETVHLLRSSQWNPRTDDEGRVEKKYRDYSYQGCCNGRSGGGGSMGGGSMGGAPICCCGC